MTTWNLHQVFVQLNLIDGYRYLDLTGVVLNRIRRDFRDLDVVDPLGTMLRTPNREGAPYSIRFTAERIWMQFAPIDTLDHVAVTAPPILRSIAEDIQASRFDRLGVRTEYLLRTQKTQEVAYTVAQNLIGGPFAQYLTTSPQEDMRLAVEVPFTFRKTNVMVRVRKIDITSPPMRPGEYPESGIVLDVDIGQRAPDATPFRRGQLASLTRIATERMRELLREIGLPLLKGVRPNEDSEISG